MYHYLYKITNLINGKIYVGIHSTNNLDDNYMGSGKLISKAIEKYGADNFTKVILTQFSNIEEMKSQESIIVNEEFIKRRDTYNIAIGGANNWLNKVSVKDKSGNTMQVSVDDPRYLSGELVHINSNMIAAKDKYGNIEHISIDDPRYLSGELLCMFKNKTAVKDKSGNTMQVSVDDPRYLSGELISIHKGKVTVKDKLGNTMSVSVADPRYLSGELVGVMKGRTFKHKKKMKLRKCPHCNKEGAGGIMGRWHFDNCKFKAQ